MSRRAQIRLTPRSSASCSSRSGSSSSLRSARAAGRTRCRSGTCRANGDLDLHLREVAEGQQPRARSARHAPGRDRPRVRRAARRGDRGGGRDPPRRSTRSSSVGRGAHGALLGRHLLGRRRRRRGAQGAGAQAGRDPVRAEADRDLGPPQARRRPTRAGPARGASAAVGLPLCFAPDGEPQGPDPLGRRGHAPAPDHPHVREAARAGGEQARALLRHRGAGRGGGEGDRDRDRARDRRRDRRGGWRRLGLRRVDHLHRAGGAARPGARRAHRRGVPAGPARS